jgi:thiol-disulfide isomerase/thioredoxin
MNKKTKNIILVALLVLIVGSIWYLESKKAPILTNTPDIVVAPVTSSSTAAVASQSSTSSPMSGSTAPVINRSAIIAQEAAEFPKAKEIVDPSGFINTAPGFTLSSIAGKKVILVDFWTYSCINCLRTIPYLNAWYQKYKDLGLEIVGIHTPEFDFEKNYDNVSAAVKMLGIQYPVVLDNDMGTWNAYQNLYWPHEYLIDIDGFIVHDQIGEGDYDVTEKAIQAALRERSDVLGLNLTIPTSIVSPSDVISIDGSQVQSPETYFGSARNEYLANGAQGSNGTQTLTLPATFDLNALYLGGTWNFQDQFAENTSPANIVFQYSAKNMYIVASSASGVKVKVLLDGKPIDPSVAGADVAADGTMTIQADRLYSIVQGASYGQHTIELEVEGPGLDAYTFTFG